MRQPTSTYCMNAPVTLPPPAETETPDTLAATANSLAAGTRLGEFELRGVLGEGGFAIVYKAHDKSLRRTVAIKEYMPGAIATRTPDGSVVPREASVAGTLQRGLDSFLDEARLLAQFDHPALIRVYRFWQQNNTAYMAMQLCQGRTLRALREEQPRLVGSEAWLKQMLAPILDALELLHAQRCYHRDISPDNIMILDSGVPMLLDFGAARQAMGDATQALTVIVKPGYAPIEQYDSVLEQGPWTDVYSLGAVLHYAITGRPVTASVSRLLKDPLPRLADTPGLAISPAFARAIDRALTVHPDERIRSITEFREALELPTFWAEMQRQSVELGALRSHSGHTGFGTLDGLEDEVAPSKAEPVDAPVDAEAEAARADIERRRRERARRQAAGQGRARDEGARRSSAHPSTGGRTKASAGRSVKARWGGHALAVTAVLALLGWAAWRPAEVPAVARAEAATPAAVPPTPLAPVVKSESNTAPALTPQAPAAIEVAATKPAAAADTVGAQLQLDVSPWGVVYVDGQMKGLTPPLKQLWLQPGRHNIEVRNTGLPTHTETITIEAGKDVRLQHQFE